MRVDKLQFIFCMLHVHGKKIDSDLLDEELRHQN